MRRSDFHKAIMTNGVGLTAPEIDFLYETLCASQGALMELTIDNWTSKIYDDITNPLQLIREVV